jgi:hypothetical protein
MVVGHAFADTHDRLRRLWFRHPPGSAVVLAGAVLLVSLIYISTCQVIINGSPDPYATDVGEIQNALPRWGTIHFNGYPLYTFLGSAFVTVLHFLGIQPAAGASLFSAFWGAMSVGLLAALAVALDVPVVLAGIAAIVFGLSTSMWMDASIAEIHTLTMALTLATLVCAVRFGRTGGRRKALWLAFLAGQMVAHQPATALLLPALALLSLPQWRTVRQELAPGGFLALLGPLTYLYLPLRVIQGADWVFGTPNTLDGFRVLVLDSKSYITVLPATLTGWLVQAERVLGLLDRDLPIVLLALGLLGLVWLARSGSRREALSLWLVAIPYVAICLIIWEDRVSDALLAAKLPVVAMAAVGLAILAASIGRRWPLLRPALVVAGLAVVLGLYQDHRPAVLAVTRDGAAEMTIRLVEQIAPASDGGTTTVLALWGVDNWALMYAQAYQHRLPGLSIVSDNVDLNAILNSGSPLLTFSRTFYMRPLDWWVEEFGRVSLQSYAPGIVSIARPSTLPPAGPQGDALFALGNGVSVREVRLSWQTPDTLLLEVLWQAQSANLHDYSVAVHLVAHDPPAGPGDILAQEDRTHPVDGWYPVSRWTVGQTVRDHYVLKVPAGSLPQAVRLGMYTLSSTGEFLNSPWLSLPLPGS